MTDEPPMRILSDGVAYSVSFRLPKLLFEDSLLISGIDRQDEIPNGV